MLGSSSTLVQSQWKCYLKPQRLSLCKPVISSRWNSCLMILSFGNFRDYFCWNGFGRPHFWVCVSSQQQAWSLPQLYKVQENHPQTVFRFKPGCLFKSIISAKANFNKFLQISCLATAHTQACNFPRKLKGSQNYIFRRVEIYTLTVS